MEAVGFAASILQLIRVLKTCRILVHDFTTSQQSQDDIRLKLFFERHFFESWCDSIGVPQSLLGDDHRQVERQVQNGDDTARRIIERLRPGLQPSNPFLVDAIAHLLVDMTKKFELAQAKFATLPGDLDTTDHTWRWTGKMKEKFRRQSSEHRPTAEKQENSRVSFPQKTKWAFLDKNTVLRLLADLRECNENLRRCMPQTYQGHVQRQANIQIISESNIEDLRLERELGAAEERSLEIGTLASIKAMQLGVSAESTKEAQLGNKERGKLSAMQSAKSEAPTKFYLEDFSGGYLGFHPIRQLAKLQQNLTAVIVEWKYYDPTLAHEITNLLEDRVKRLVTMLQTCQRSPEFQVPICYGLFKDERAWRYGIVYEVPSLREPASPISDTKSPFQSLYEVIVRTRTAKRVPFLGDRILVAKNLALALHKFHSVGWLHKSLRADNVVCFHEPLPDHLPPFQLMGFDFSRPNEPGELTETRPTEVFRLHRDNIELYTHPDAIGGTKDSAGQSFRPEFDIYSLGLILLEIGCWQPLRYLREKKDSIDVCRRRWREDYLHELKHRTGEIYWRVTQRCLNNDFDLNEAYESKAPGMELQLAFEKQVVWELERLVI